MRYVLLLWLSLAACVSIVQASEVSVTRSVLPYEILDAVPEGMDDASDRDGVADFLAKKRQAQVDFENEILKNVCPPFLNDEWTTAEVAAQLDQEAKWLDLTIAAAYDEMTERLSVSGAADIGDAVHRESGRTVTEWRMVGLEEAAPDALERIVGYICKSKESSPADEESSPADEKSSPDDP